MELIEWAIQLKSLASSNLANLIQALTANLNQYQNNTYGVALIILTSYSGLILIKRTSSRIQVLAAFLFCMIIARSPIYDELSGVQYHALFGIIYMLLTYLVRPNKAKVACCTLGSFQILMAWDSLANATVQTFIWSNYEAFTLLLHAFIVGSFLERDIERFKSALDVINAVLRNLFRYACNSVRLWYYYTNVQLSKIKR